MQEEDEIEEFDEVEDLPEGGSDAPADINQEKSENDSNERF